VKTRIVGISEINPILVSDEKKIFYDLMENIRNIKTSNRKENVQERKYSKRKSLGNRNSKFRINFVDCLVVDKMLEKTDNKKFKFKCYNDIIKFQTSSNLNSTLDFGKNNSKNNFNSTALSFNSQSINPKNDKKFLMNGNFNTIF
jgi:hypothetical protein